MRRSAEEMLVVASLPLFAYGALNVCVPRLTTRWQISSTAKHGADVRGSVGRAVQGWLGTGPQTTPDGNALRRVRVVGAVEMGLAVVLVVTGLALM